MKVLVRVRVKEEDGCKGCHFLLSNLDCKLPKAAGNTILPCTVKSLPYIWKLVKVRKIIE